MNGKLRKAADESWLQNVEAHKHLAGCERCKGPIQLPGAKLCNCCWETEHRIEIYLKSPGGRAHVRKLLEKYDATGTLGPAGASRRL